MNRLLLTVLIAGATASLTASVTACGTDTGNGIVTVKTALTSSDSMSSLAAHDTRGSAMTIDSARAYVRDIQFDRPGGKTDCSGFSPSNNSPVKCDGAKIRINGPFAVDMVAKSSMPSLEKLEFPPDVYSRVDITLDEAKPSDGVVPMGDALSGFTVIASGTLAYPAGQTTHYDFALTFTETARFESAAGIAVDAGAVQTFLLDLDVAKWFATLPISDCIDAGDLEIRMGAVTIADKGNGGCKMIENALKDAIKGSGKLEKESK